MQAPDAKNTPEASKTSQSGMTFLGLDLDTSVSIANGTVVFLGVLLAIVSVIAFRWNDQLQARKDAELARFQKDSRAATALADVRAAEASRAAVEARERLLQLQERLKDRAFNDEQRTKLLDHFSLGPRCPVQIFSAINDDEGERFATTILGVLQQAGWNVELFRTHDMISPGLGLAQKTAGDPTPCLANLRDAFQSVGLRPFMQTYGGDFPERSVHVLVGPKPQP